MPGELDNHVGPLVEQLLNRSEDLRRRGVPRLARIGHQCPDHVDVVVQPQQPHDPARNGAAADKGNP